MLINVKTTMMIIAAHLLGAFLNWAIQKKKDKEEPGEEKEDKNNEVTKKQKVILLWDSHMEALVLPELEKIAHFDLVAPGALRAKNITTMGGHSQRAYNSVFNWPGARFPRGCQEYRVAEMLSIGSYDILVLSLCCNDISNLTSTPTNLHLFFAETSGLNTLHIAENALCRFPKLKKVVILDAPPRIDSRNLAALSRHRSDYLAWRLPKSPHSSKIAFKSLKSLEGCEEYLFPRGSDGIHMRGLPARKLYTMSVYEALMSM